MVGTKPRTFPFLRAARDQLRISSGFSITLTSGIADEFLKSTTIQNGFSQRHKENTKEHKERRKKGVGRALVFANYSTLARCFPMMDFDVTLSGT